MKRVKQQRETDCGFACIAMLVCTTLEAVQQRAESLNLRAGSGARRGSRTFRGDLSRLAKSYSLSFGKRVKFDHQHRDHGVSLSEFECSMARRHLGQSALIAVDREPRGKGLRPDWHWVVWDQAELCILDPKRSFRRKLIRPWYYISVGRS